MNTVNADYSDRTCGGVYIMLFNILKIHPKAYLLWVPDDHDCVAGLTVHHTDLMGK